MHFLLVFGVFLLSKTEVHFTFWFHFMEMEWNLFAAFVILALLVSFSFPEIHKVLQSNDIVNNVNNLNC